MNRYKCPACGGNQYTACDTAEGCIYCGNKELGKMDKLEPEPPIKIIRENFMIKYYCPICNNDEIRGHDYCSRCGKKIDWYTEVLPDGYKTNYSL